MQSRMKVTKVTRKKSLATANVTCQGIDYAMS